MTRQLIPPDVNIMEQIEIKRRFQQLVDAWRGNLLRYDPPYLSTNALLKDSGVRCNLLGEYRLTGFIVEDEAQYAWFILKWS